MFNTGIIKLKNCSDSKGMLVPIEAKKDVPFDIKRIYYISKVKENTTRGFHSHRMLHQLLICVSGTVKVRIKNTVDEEIVPLSSDSSHGLYIGPMIWREMFDFSEDAVLLVLASEKYDEGDYIRDYESYFDEAKVLFGS